MPEKDHDVTILLPSENDCAITARLRHSGLEHRQSSLQGAAVANKVHRSLGSGSVMHKLRGFTLLELMVVVAVAAIVLTLGVPQFGEFLRNSRRAELSTGLFSALSQARTEAVVRNTEITVAPSGESWTAGWRVFIDTNTNGLFDSGDTAVAEYDIVHDDLELITEPETTLLRFQRSGRANQTVRFTLCAKTRAHTREVTAEVSGRISLRDLGDLSDSGFAARCGSA
jgi:type IV fimbrial biogenesis protein FimT